MNSLTSGKRKSTHMLLSSILQPNYACMWTGVQGGQARRGQGACHGHTSYLRYKYFPLASLHVRKFILNIIYVLLLFRLATWTTNRRPTHHTLSHATTTTAPSTVAAAAAEEESDNHFVALRNIQFDPPRLCNIYILDNINVLPTIDNLCRGELSAIHRRYNMS